MSTEDALQEIADFGQLQDKREWVGLTDEEIHDIVYEQVAGYIVPPNPSFGFRVAANIEAKLKEKNT